MSRHASHNIKYEISQSRVTLHRIFLCSNVDGYTLIEIGEINRYQNKVLKYLTLKPLLNIVVDRVKNSNTEQPDNCNHVQMDEKTSKNAKIMKETLSLSRYL